MASVICFLLSSGSSHGYLSSLVGTLVSSVIVSVHVDISDGSIGLLYAKGLGLKVAGLTLSCINQLGNVWSGWLELDPLILPQNKLSHCQIKIQL